MGHLSNLLRKLRAPGQALGLAVVILVSAGIGYALRGCGTHYAEAGPGTAAQTTAASENDTAAGKTKPVQMWTCSMHPQIRLPKPGKCPICSMDLIPLETGTAAQAGLRQLTVSPEAAELMELETTPVERRFVTATVRMVGKIDYDETRVSDITAWVPGRLDRLYVDYTGVPVRKGDHMVSLYSPELLTAQQELLQALRTVEELSRSDVDIVRKTADQTVAAARDKLRLWGLTTEQIAEIEKRDKADDHITIYAPEGGIVVNKNAQEGMYVKTGTRIYTIADLSHLWVNLQAYESDLMWLRYGQDVEFTTEAYPGVVFNGVISFIHPVLDEATRTVKLRVNVQNRDGRLKPGMFVRGRAQASVATEGRVMDPGLAGKWIGPMHPGIVKDHPGNCDICGMPLVKAESLGYVGKQPTDADKPLVIPTSAALITGKRAVVYVEVPDAEKPTFEGREIVLGPRAGDYYLVRRGLAEGEMVVTRGTFKLDAELQIQAKPSMMTPAGGQPPGGHHHGKNAEKTGTMAETGEAAAPSLPVAVQSQLSEVVAQAAAAIDISKGDELNLIRDAYADLGTSVDAVQDRALSGHPAMLWKEYGMLLGNDAAIGVDIKTAEEAGNLAETTRKHLDRMTQAFGLAQNKKAQPEPVEVNPQFTEQLKGLVDAYTEMHDALADDKHQPAKKAASDALDALGKIDMELLRGDAHMQWMKDAENLRDPLQKIAQSDSLETDRTNFAMLSEQMAAVLTRFGVPEGTLYKAWCPMAFQDRGALWLQKTKDIENPYLGHAMPRCGEIKGALK